jgi:hypothetical protein
MKRIKEDKQKELAIMELAREADESLEEIAEGYKVQL